MKNKTKLFFAFLAIWGLAISTAQAYTVVRPAAYFEDADLSGIDSYAGASGDGWNNPWCITHAGTGTWAAALGTATPIDATSGTYLTYAQTDDITSGASASLNRRYYLDQLGDEYTVSFDIRFDDISMWTDMDSVNGTSVDRFYMSGVDGDYYSHQVFHTGFDIRVIGNFNDYSLATALQFRFLCGSTGAGSSISEYSGFTVQEGNVYHLDIGVHNTNFTYEATVTDVTTGQSYTTTTPLNMTSQTVIDYLSFITEMRYEGGKAFGYSLDNIEFSNNITLGGMTQVVANFDGGNDDTVVDAYPGMAGNGWSNAWRGGLFEGTCVETITVNSASPVHAGDGNYMTLSVTNDDDAVASYGISRNYKADGGLDFTKNHSISFTVRIDEPDIGSPYFDMMTSVDDKYILTSSDTEEGLVNPTDTYAIFAQGADGAGIVAQHWTLVDGSNDGDLANCTYVDSGISLTTGGVYDFTITYDVDAKTYDVTIDDGVNTPVTVTDLGWITADDVVGGYLHFSTSAAGQWDTRSLSLDNVLIETSSAVPEPSTMIGLIALLLAGLALARRR